MAAKKLRLIRVFAGFTLALTFMLAVLVVLSYIIRIDDVVEAQGHVESQTVYAVRAASDGYVEQVRVKEGATVQKGEAVATLLNEALENQLRELKISLTQLERRRAETQERYDYLKNVSHPSDRESAQLRLEKMKTSLAGVDAQKRAQQSEANRMDFLMSRELVSQRQNDQAKLQARLSEVKEKEENQTLTQLQHDYDTLLKSQEADLRRLQHETTQNLLETEKLQLEIAELEKKHSHSAITAPASGIVSLGQDSEKMVGQFVRTGERFADLIDVQGLIFIALIPEAEVRKLREGQAVNLELTALPYQKYKVFRGQIENISTHPERDKATGIALYSARIRLQDTFVEMNENAQTTQFFLKPGFSGVARIIVRNDMRFASWIRKQVFGESF